MMLQLDHKKATDLYHETVDLDNAFKKQITDAIEGIYLEELRDAMTNTIVHTIPQIFDHLYTAYGDITSEALREREEKVRSMSYTLTEPLTNIFTEVENLQKLGIAAGLTYTPEQLKEIALGIIKRTGDLQEGLSD